MAEEPKYIVNSQPDQLSDNEVNATKDFKKLTYRYQKATTPVYKTPLYKFKNRKVLFAIILIVLLIWLIYLASQA